VSWNKQTGGSRGQRLAWLVAGRANPNEWFNMGAHSAGREHQLRLTTNGRPAGIERARPPATAAHTGAADMTPFRLADSGGLEEICERADKRAHPGRQLTPQRRRRRAVADDKRRPAMVRRARARQTYD
jgi:hypothetical protein